MIANWLSDEMKEAVDDRQFATVVAVSEILIQMITIALFLLLRLFFLDNSFYAE